MLTTAMELAAALPETWSDRFSGEDEALRKKNELQGQRQTLVGAVELSIDVSKQRDEQASTPDPWVKVSLADFRFLTADRPGPVVRAYQDAVEGQPDFVGDSVRGQLRLYQELDLLTEKVNRVLAVLAPPAPASATPAAPRTILFTGHQVDAPGRQEPRFPADKEPLARAAIREAVLREAAGPGGAVGLAGAASGGDILFHEVCAELGIATGCTWPCPRSSTSRSRSRLQAATGSRAILGDQGSLPAAPILARQHRSSRMAAAPGVLLDLAAEQPLDAQRSARRRSTEPDRARPVEWQAGDGPGGTAQT